MPEEDLEEGDQDKENLEKGVLDREDLEKECSMDYSVWMDVSQPVLMVPCLSVQMVPHPWARDVKIEANQPAQTMRNHKPVQMDPPQLNPLNHAQREDHPVKITQDHLVKMTRAQKKENVLMVRPLPVKMEKDQSVRMDLNQLSPQPAQFEVSVQSYLILKCIFKYNFYFSPTLGFPWLMKFCSKKLVDLPRAYSGTSDQVAFEDHHRSKFVGPPKSKLKMPLIIWK